MLDALERHLTYTNSWAAVRLMFWKLRPLRFLETCLHISPFEPFKRVSMGLYSCKNSTALNNWKLCLWLKLEPPETGAPLLGWKKLHLCVLSAHLSHSCCLFCSGWVHSLNLHLKMQSSGNGPLFRRHLSYAKHKQYDVSSLHLFLYCLATNQWIRDPIFLECKINISPTPATFEWVPIFHESDLAFRDLTGSKFQSKQCQNICKETAELAKVQPDIYC